MAGTTNKMLRTILLVPKSHYLYQDAKNIVENSSYLVAVFDDQDIISESAVAELNFDVLISFLSRRVLKGELLSFPNINFHPGPPEYPGRGGASFALFEGISDYGATAHQMVSEVDAGGIYQIKRFPIYLDDNCESLFSRAEMACRDLLLHLCEHLKCFRALPPLQSELRWRRKATTRKEFEEWLMLNPDDPAEFRKKIRAAQHSKFPGPFVMLHGFKFSLHKK